ncbi:STU1 [Candida jiufengensis]|uniref:STU1 n=1 Tax=Candida jiufengensis TaxID=497108 RepID=UPI002224539D|nr:STU1 [Candida jiufengensis]KAI5951954.1 STU1 [Candida jiufengensis]
MINSDSAKDLLDTFNSDTISNNAKFEHIQSLKTHIKKDSIDLLKVPIYLQIIMKGLELNDSRITSVSFNSLSYLIKRISVQDKSGKILKDQSFLILPILINKLGSSNTSVAKKALEDYWLSSPNEVEKALNEISFNTNNKQLIIESIRWIIQIVKDISKKFNIAYFIPDIIRSLSNISNDKELIDTVNSLMDIFVQNSNDTDAANHIQDQFDLFNIPHNGVSITLPRSKSNSAASTSTINQSISSNFGKSNGSFTKPSAVEEFPKIRENKSQEVQPFEAKLSELLLKNKYELESSIGSKEILNATELYNIFDSYINHFEGKETESNWKLREKDIVEVRGIIRGSASIKFISDLISCLKNFAVPLCKGASSLRTTLCTHSCQLIKECAIIFEVEFDACAELIFPTLMKQCLSTKNITSSNANMAVAAFYANLPYNQRLLNKISSSMAERNHQPRLFSTLWLQILLLRYSLDNSFFGHHLPHVIDISNKLLIKLLKDANPNVRQMAKDYYWCYSQILPEESEKLVKRLDSSTVKALERSQREFSFTTTTPTTRVLTSRSSRPSLREPMSMLMSERARETKQERSSSRMESRESSHNPSVLSLPKRNPKLDNKPPHITNRPSPRASSWNPQPKPTNSAERERSRTEVLKTSPLENEEIVKNSPKLESKEPLKNRHEIMIEYFASKDADKIYEGVIMLISAIYNKDDFTNSYTLKSKLRYISEKDPFLLKQLFPSTNNELFRKSSKLFSIEDFNRTCCILFNDLDQNVVDLICSCYELSDFIDTHLKLLNYTIEYPNIPGNNNFKLQISNYQFKIAQSCLQALSIVFINSPITDVQFGEIFHTLVSLIMVSKQHSKTFYLLKQLFCQLYSNDCNKFLSLLDDIEFNLKDEVELIVGIDNNIMTVIEKPLDNSVFEMTEINPGKIEIFEPKESSNGGFTMVVPHRNSNDLLDHEEAEDEDMKDEPQAIHESNDIDDPFIETSFHGKPFKLVKHRYSTEKEDQGGISHQSSETLNSINSKKSESLVDEFSQINIAPPPFSVHHNRKSSPTRSPTIESLQTMIEKVDPLNPISNKIRKISIYEDNDCKKTSENGYNNSNGKLYMNNNHQDWNWENITYNVNSFKFNNFNIGNISSVEQFEFSCVKLANFIVNNSEEEEEINGVISNLSSTLESLTTTNYEFREFFLKNGKHKLSNSLISFSKNYKFANNTNNGNNGNSEEIYQQQSQRILDFLYLLKLILKYDELIDLHQVWEVLNKLNSLIKIENQLYYAWIEILQQINSNNNLNQKMYEIIIESFEKLSTESTNNEFPKNSQIIINLSLIYLSNFINNLEFLNQEEINLKKLDLLLGNFFNSNDINLRKNSIICYSKLFKISSNFDFKTVEVLNQLKKKYSISQQRLIEFYSQK